MRHLPEKQLRHTIAGLDAVLRVLSTSVSYSQSSTSASATMQRESGRTVLERCFLKPVRLLKGWVLRTMRAFPTTKFLAVMTPYTEFITALHLVGYLVSTLQCSDTVPLIAEENHTPVVVSAVRTPFGSLQGSLSSFSATQLGSFAIQGA